MATGIFQGISAGADAIADGIRRRRELVLAQQEKQEARAYEQSIYERGKADQETERSRVSEEEDRKFQYFKEGLGGKYAGAKNPSEYEGMKEADKENQLKIETLAKALKEAIDNQDAQSASNWLNEYNKLMEIQSEPVTPEHFTNLWQSQQTDEMDLARARNPVKPIVQGSGTGGGQVAGGGRTIQSVNKQDFKALSEAQTTWDSQRTSDDMSQSRSMAKNQIVNLLMKYGIQADDQMAVRVLDKVPGYSFNEIIQRGSGSPSTQPSSGQESQAVGKDGKPIFKDGKAVMTDGAGNYWIGE